MRSCLLSSTQTTPNYVYLIFSVATLALGCIALVIGGSIAIWMDDFPTMTAKSIFAREVQPCVNLLFLLYHSSLKFWLVAMMASSAVKYETYWYFSFSTSLAAIVVICVSWLVILCKKRDLKTANPDMDGARAGSIGWRQLFAPVGATLRAFFSVEGGGGVADPYAETEAASFTHEEAAVSPAASLGAVRVASQPQSLSLHTLELPDSRTLHALKEEARKDGFCPDKL